MTSVMAKINLKYLERRVDERGNTRWYVRLSRDTPRIAIPKDLGSPDNPAFMSAYRAIIDGKPSTLPPATRTRHAAAGTVRWLIAQYQASSAWATLSNSTRRTRSKILEKIALGCVDDRGRDFLIEQLDREAIWAGRERRAETPQAANHFVKTIRVMFNWALHEAKIVDHNPARDIKMFAESPTGFKVALASEIAAYRDHWKLGSRQRLGLELALYTGLRRCDLVRVGPAHVNGDMITIRSAKTPNPLVPILIVAPLVEALAATPRRGLTFIETKDGHPYQVASFGNEFREWAKAAGMSTSLHGLRKRAATEMAEAGMTALQLQAAFGWSTLQQAERYTKAADRNRLARDGWAGLEQHRINLSPNTAPRGGNTREKAMKSDAK